MKIRGIYVANKSIRAGSVHSSLGSRTGIGEVSLSSFFAKVGAHRYHA